MLFRLNADKELLTHYKGMWNIDTGNKFFTFSLS